MKTLIFFLLISLTGFSQVDSSKIKITVSLQARDCEYLGSFVPFNENYEDIFDGIKAKFRVANSPTGNTVVQIDTVQIIQWINVSVKIRSDAIAILAGIHTRLDNALRAVNIDYLTNRLNVYATADTTTYTSNRNLGRFKLRRL